MKKIFLILALVFTLIPSFFVIRQVGGISSWNGVPPAGVTDSLYYYARIHEVADGHPFIGNPYVFEYRNGFSPAFFLPDIIAALPVLLGLPFIAGMVLNVFIWSFLFLVLSFALLRLLQMPKRWALVWTILLYLVSYSFMLRPVVMQIVYPFFLLFLIAFLRFLYAPLEKRKIYLLSLVAASTFYIYTYLAYIVILVFIFTFLWFLFSRRFKELRSLTMAGVFTAIMLIPFGIYTIIQIRSPYYIETLTRIGLVFTHIPATEAFLYGRWIVIALIALGLLWKFFPKKEEGDSEQKIFWLATGASLFVGLFLNVITGAELSLAIHIGRFVILWMALVTGIGLYEWYSFSTFRNNRAKYIVVAVFLIILIGGVARNVPRGLVFFEFPERGENIVDVQTYAAPLRWLNQHVSNESVIWANDSVSEYIPILTRHYPLFASAAAIHNTTGRELEDRFLLSRSLYTLKIEDFKSDFGLYSGAGQSEEQPLAQNRRAWICDATQRFWGGLKCPSYTDSITLRGEEYFKELSARFEDIKKNRTVFLKQYNVSYLIIDRTHDNPELVPNGKSVYDNGRFEILQLSL
jgi:hypothetical protein